MHSATLVILILLVLCAFLAQAYYVRSLHRFLDETIEERDYLKEETAQLRLYLESDPFTRSKGEWT